MHRKNARAWSLCGVVIGIIASINTSLATFPLSISAVPSGTETASCIYNLAAYSLSDPEVQRYVQRYVADVPFETERILGRAEVFFPEIEDALEQAGLPDALKYLPMVESTLLPGVVSPAGAAGLWQIMPSTARYLGLRVDHEMDERFDPVLSCKAALRMLEELHMEFGDWLLALAAYNCGAGRVHSALKKAGSRDYERLRNFLPVQTRNYVSKYLAMADIGQNWQRYGLKPVSDRRFPEIQIKEIQVGSYFNFHKVSSLLGISREALRRLNPAYRTDYVFGSKDEHTLRVPAALAYRLVAQNGEQADRFTIHLSRFFPLHDRLKQSPGVQSLLQHYLLLKKELRQLPFRGFGTIFEEEGVFAVLDNLFVRYVLEPLKKA